MTIDTLLLDRLRQAGLEDGMIRHLHDEIVTGSTRRRERAIHYASTAVESPVRHYSTGEGITAEITLASGVQWTGRALRLSATQAIPATVMTSLAGRRMCDVARFPGSDRMTIADATTTKSGETWISARAAVDEPPSRASAWRRLHYRRTISRDDRRRRRPHMRTYRSLVSGTLAIILLAVLLPVVVVYTQHLPTILRMSCAAACWAVAALTFNAPWPQDDHDAAQDHLAEMRDIQHEQGW